MGLHKTRGLVRTCKACKKLYRAFPGTLSLAPIAFPTPSKLQPRGPVSSCLVPSSFLAVRACTAIKALKGFVLVAMSLEEREAAAALWQWPEAEIAWDGKLGTRSHASDQPGECMHRLSLLPSTTSGILCKTHGRLMRRWGSGPLQLSSGGCI